MTKREYLLKKFDEDYKGYLENKIDYIYNPSVIRTEPFKIADGLYYVGDKKVCVHLLDTGDGLILIDSGYLGGEHILVDSIWRAGFDPKDIKMIIHTHGHSDHYGASDEFSRMYGCKLAISRVDAEWARKRAVDGMIGGKFHPLAKLPQFDYEIEDGDVIEMGNVKILCVLTPGHTSGVITLFFDVTYDGKTYRAGLFGGAGVNALKLTYIYKNDYDEDNAQQMLNSIEKMRGEKVDIHLGNHPANNKTFEKREKQISEGGNPFIDENSWKTFLDDLEVKVNAIIAENEKLDKEIDELLSNK